MLVGIVLKALGMNDLSRFDLDGNDFVSDLNQKIDFVFRLLVCPIARSDIQLQKQCLKHIVLGKRTFELGK